MERSSRRNRYIWKSRKSIKVVYTNIDAKQNAIKNTIKGQIKTYTPDKTSEEVTDTAETTTGFTVDIPVSKIWDDEDNKVGKRPESVIFKLTGSDGQFQEQKEVQQHKIVTMQINGMIYSQTFQNMMQIMKK